MQLAELSIDHSKPVELTTEVCDKTLLHLSLGAPEGWWTFMNIVTRVR